MTKDKIYHFCTKIIEKPCFKSLSVERFISRSENYFSNRCFCFGWIWIYYIESLFSIFWKFLNIFSYHGNFWFKEANSSSITAQPYLFSLSSLAMIELNDKDIKCEKVDVKFFEQKNNQIFQRLDDWLGKRWKLVSQIIHKPIDDHLRNAGLQRSHFKMYGWTTILISEKQTKLQ